MELTLVGLQNAGKTTLVNVISNGQFDEDTIPTVGFNLRKVRRGGVSIKLWDIGGQPRFRSMWERYCRGCNAIVYVVDAADFEAVPEARKELHELMNRPGNKNDLPSFKGTEELQRDLDLHLIDRRDVSIYSISAKNSTNIDKVLDWLTKQAKRK